MELYRAQKFSTAEAAAETSQICYLELENKISGGPTGANATKHNKEGSFRLLTLRRTQ